jgi:hypothetical protein
MPAPSNGMIVWAPTKPDCDPERTGCSAGAERQCAGRALHLRPKKEAHIPCHRHWPLSFSITNISANS